MKTDELLEGLRYGDYRILRQWSRRAQCHTYCVLNRHLEHAGNLSTAQFRRVEQRVRLRKHYLGDSSDCMLMGDT